LEKAKALDRCKGARRAPSSSSEFVGTVTRSTWPVALPVRSCLAQGEPKTFKTHQRLSKLSTWTSSCNVGTITIIICGYCDCLFTTILSLSKLKKWQQFSLLKSSKIPLHPPFPMGEKAEGIFPRIPQNTPPFEKGRTGGISGKAVSKR
jgi:hypothetical protein